MSTEGLYYDGEDERLTHDSDAAREERVRQMLREAYGAPEPFSGRTEEFTLDGSTYYQVSRAHWERMMIMAPPGIRALNMPRETAIPARDAGAAEALGWAMHPGLPVAEDTPPPGAWPDLGIGWAVEEILAAIRLVDWHLDEAAPAIYRDNPLANRWRRIAAGPASEGQEAVDALNLATGGNPRKGVIGNDETILGELGDGAVANLLAIQSVLKDTDATWAVFTAALAKALARVPRERPEPRGEPS